jgi:hypothetical protein
MQNKPNFQTSQMNVNPYNRRIYENKPNWTLGENKPNSNPNKANFRKAKMNANAFSQKDYENETTSRLLENKPNQTQFQRRKNWFIRLIRRWTKRVRAMELFGEKNRLGRGSNLGQAGGNLCLWGPERFFSIVRNARSTRNF